MPTRPHQDRLRMVGREIQAARKRLGMSRADLAGAAGISQKSLARLESGQEVRLSTYLVVTRHLASRQPGVIGIADRVALLPDLARARVLELVERFEKIERTEKK